MLWGRSLSSLTLGRRSGICQKLWQLAGASLWLSQWWGRALVGACFRPAAWARSSGASKTAEYSALAILSSPMTSAFALGPKVRASSHCFPSVPGQPGHHPSLNFPSLGANSEEKWGSKKLQGLLAQPIFNRGTTWAGETTFRIHGTIGAGVCSQATSGHSPQRRGEDSIQDHTGNQ